MFKAKERHLEPPEQFYKAKRALLLFSTFSFLLAVADVEAPHLKISLFGSNVTISHWVLALSLWSYCAFLFASFWREKQYVEFLHSPEMIANDLQGGVDALDTLLSRRQHLIDLINHNIQREATVSQTLHEVEGILGKAQMEFQQEARALQNAIDTAKGNSVYTLATVIDMMDAPIPRDQHAGILDQMTRAIDDYAQAKTRHDGFVDRRVSEFVIQCLNTLPAKIARETPPLVFDHDIRALLVDMRRRFQGLSDAIHTRDRNYYAGLDLAPAYFMFTVATLAPLIDFFGDDMFPIGQIIARAI